MIGNDKVVISVHSNINVIILMCFFHGYIQFCVPSLGVCGARYLDSSKIVDEL